MELRRSVHRGKPDAGVGYDPTSCQVSTYRNSSKIENCPWCDNLVTVENETDRMSATIYELRGTVALITMDNPPVNGLGFDLRHDIVEGLARAEADANVRPWC